MDDQDLRQVVGRSGLRDLRSTVLQLGGVVVIAFAGEIDLFTAPAAHSAVRQALPIGRASTTIVVVDLSEVMFLGSKGLQLLLDLADATSDRGMQLRVVPGNHHSVVRPLEITGIDTVLALFPTREHALTSR